MSYRVPSTKEFVRFNKETIAFKGGSNKKKIVWHLPELTEEMKRKVLLGGHKGNLTEGEEAPYWAREYAASYLKNIADEIYEFLEHESDDPNDKEDQEHRFLDV